MADNEEIISSKIGKLLKISRLTAFRFGIPVLKPYIG
jgi:hypothetical protein